MLKGNSPRVKALYYPQYHTFLENDRAWGKGFAERINVTRGQPYFRGYIQPNMPANLGFYDLSNIEKIKFQIDLPSHYGVTKLCFHYYWFHGEKVLQKPWENFMKINPARFKLKYVGKTSLGQKYGMLASMILLLSKKLI